MPGLRVLLSNYVALVVSRGPGILSSFSHPSWVVYGSSELGWGSYGRTKGIFLVLKALFILAPASAGLFGVFHLCHIVALLPGAGVRCPFLSSRASWRRLRTPPPLLVGLRASLYRPNQMRHNRNGRLVYPVRAVRCYLTALLLIVSDASGSFLLQGVARRSYRRPLSPSGSGCRCHGYAGSRLRNGLSLELGALMLSLRLFFEKTLAVIVGGRASMRHWHTSLRCCYLGAVAPRFLAVFHRACVVAVQALVLPGPARLGISLLTDWKLALGPCFLVHSPTICRRPMGCHGWRFVYVSTS